MLARQQRVDPDEVDNAAQALGATLELLQLLEEDAWCPLFANALPTGFVAFSLSRLCLVNLILDPRLDRVMHLAKLLQILCAPETKHHVVHVSAIELAEYLASISAEEHTPLSLEVHQFREMDVAHFDYFGGICVRRAPNGNRPFGRIRSAYAWQAFPYAADGIPGQVRQTIRAVYQRIGKCVSSETIGQQDAPARNIYGLLRCMVEHTPHQCRHGFALMIQVNGSD